MNIKTMAALVGALSLSTLATGCAAGKSATAASEPQDVTQSESQTGSTEAQGSETQTDTQAGSTSEKGSEHSCGAGGCGGSKPQ